VGKKLNLPLFEEPRESGEGGSRKRAKPSIDAARSRLGGRLRTEPGAASSPSWLVPGTVVSFGARRRTDLDERPDRVGVVIFASATEVHVLLDGVRMRRLTPGDVHPHAAEVPLELARLGADARLFGRLTEGEAVRYAAEGGQLVDGKVVEKCRWGALVLRDDGTIIAVGFRKLWPMAAEGVA
jgi:hypothetical protein